MYLDFRDSGKKSKNAIANIQIRNPELGKRVIERYASEEKKWRIQEQDQMERDMLFELMRSNESDSVKHAEFQRYLNKMLGN
jgi:hypothetical protein